MSAGYIGLDIGTSGCRACLIDAAGTVLAEARTALPPGTVQSPCHEQNPQDWWQAAVTVLSDVAAQAADPIHALAVDGTSGSILLVDADGNPLTPGLMYNDARATLPAERIRTIAPETSGAHGATSGLAKWLWLADRGLPATTCFVVNQADWMAGRLTGDYGKSDENNALKLGYDPVARTWPSWLDALGLAQSLLPQVLKPGMPRGHLCDKVAGLLGLSTTPLVMAGTTDSVASFIATGANSAGDAVTALGSTLALKVIAPQPVFSPANGVYSHRLRQWWLAGGASNCGGAVLRQFFSQADIDRMTTMLRPDRPTGLDYYPLPGIGERFPNADAWREPCLTPRPNDDLVFFQGLLEGLARVEQRGYERLRELGAPYPQRVFSIGGGAANAAFRQIRSRLLGVPVVLAERVQAAYGAALLARDGYQCRS